MFSYVFIIYEKYSFLTHPVDTKSKGHKNWIIFVIFVIYRKMLYLRKCQMLYCKKFLNILVALTDTR